MQEEGRQGPLPPVCTGGSLIRQKGIGIVAPGNYFGRNNLLPQSGEGLAACPPLIGRQKKTAPSSIMLKEAFSF